MTTAGALHSLLHVYYFYFFYGIVSVIGNVTDIHAQGSASITVSIWCAFIYAHANLHMRYGTTNCRLAILLCIGCIMAANFIGLGRAAQWLFGINGGVALAVLPITYSSCGEAIE